MSPHLISKQTKIYFSLFYLLLQLTSSQDVCYKLDFPRGLLVRWFIALYVNDIVEEEVTLISNPIQINFEFNFDGH